MEKLDMQTKKIVQDNLSLIKNHFPNAITELTANIK